MMTIPRSYAFAGSSTMARERVLLIDDNAVTLKLTRALLELESYEIATAPSAEAALETIGEFRPQLVLTDVRLTGMDGLELTRRLRSTPQWRSIPIIAITGLNEPEDEREALTAGCNAWLSKPVQSQVLRNLVRQHLNSQARISAEPEVVQNLIDTLRVDFLRAGGERCRRLLAMLPIVAPERNLAELFDYRAIHKALHDWAGAGGTFGLPRITEKAREAETLLKQPLEQVAMTLRSAMESLLEQFTYQSPGLQGPTVGPDSPLTPEQKPEILVCDGDPLVAAIVKSTLEAYGMNCRVAGNGTLAVAMTCNDRTDAIILEVDLPVLDGIQVLDELRSIESTRNLKVMILTARYEADDITRFVEHGADDCMAKPFDPAALVERLKTMLAMP
jgi:CheY-like chemotaxis protein